MQEGTNDLPQLPERDVDILLHRHRGAKGCGNLKESSHSTLENIKLAVKSTSTVVVDFAVNLLNLRETRGSNLVFN